MFQQNAAKTTIEYLDEYKTPLVGITTKALMKMRAYVQENSQEISWLGFVHKDEDNDYIIEDVMLLEQKVTYTTTEIDEGALSAFGSKLLETGGVELYNKVKMWGHSHVNMPVFASGTDEATFKMFYEHNDFFIRLICNKKDEITIDVMDCVAKVKFLNVEWYEVKSEEQLQLEELVKLFQKQQETTYKKITEEAKVEIKEMIKTSYTSTYAAGYGKGGYGTRGYDDDDYAAGYPKGDRFVQKKTEPIKTAVEIAKEKAKVEEREKALDEAIERQDVPAIKAIAAEVEAEKEAEEKKTAPDALSPLPDIIVRYAGHVEVVPALEIFEDADEVAALMYSTFSAMDLGSRLSARYQEFENYQPEDWNMLYDDLFEWYYDNYLDIWDDDETLLRT